MNKEYPTHLRVVSSGVHNEDFIKVTNIYSDNIEDALFEVFNQVDLQNSYEVKEFRAMMGSIPEDRLLQFMENEDEDDWDWIIQIKDMNSNRILYESCTLVIDKTVKIDKEENHARI